MRKRRFIIRLTLQVLGAQCMTIGGLAVLLWLLGRVLSDRSAFSQWLLWIPTLAMAPAVALGLIGSLAPVRKPVLQRRRFWVWAIAALVIAACFCFVEHRLLTPAPAAGRGLSITGWTMTFRPADEQRPEVADRVVEHLGDLTIITEGWFLHQNNLLRSRLSDDVLLHRVHPFTIVSRLPLIESRPIVAHEHIRFALLRLDASEQLGRELVVYAIDLPSIPSLPRMDLAREARELLAQTDAPPPDVVIGDFNMTRNSAAMRFIFPGLHHAFTDGGHGYTASYHRALPLYHIDHLLLRDDLRAARYDVIDPGFGRHCLQRAWVQSAGD